MGQHMGHDGHRPVKVCDGETGWKNKAKLRGMKNGCRQYKQCVLVEMEGERVNGWSVQE
jgi:hypothetical protein